MATFTKAQRKKARLRLALAGPAGSGKTYSALLIAFGLGGRVAMIDTERSSGELYSDLGDYDVCALEPPFTPKNYIEAIRTAESAGYNVIIIDSLSHAWAGPGGVLDMHDAATQKERNSWAAWRNVTPLHNELVDTMLQCKAHLIATMRSKTEYAQVQEGGKARVQKVGMAPVQRDGMEYEFTVFCDLDLTHTAVATKDRTGMFDGITFRPIQETGKNLLAWLNAGESGGKPADDKAPPEEAGSETLPKPREAKPEPPKAAPEPPEEPQPPKPEPHEDAPAGEFQGQLIAMENARKVKSYLECDAFDPITNTQYLLRGKKIPEDIKEKELIAVTGPVNKDKVIRPTQVLRLGAPAAPTKAPAPAETPAETGGRYMVTLTTDPKAGTRTFSEGPPHEPITWARATLDGKPIFICARQEFQELLKPIQNGARITVYGELETGGRETFLHLKGVESAASSAA